MVFEPLVFIPVNSPGVRVSVVLSPLAVSLSFEHPINRKPINVSVAIDFIMIVFM
jgi:hypothetical protein